MQGFKGEEHFWGRDASRIHEADLPDMEGVHYLRKSSEHEDDVWYKKKTVQGH